jgi:hypothetical protein
LTNHTESVVFDHVALDYLFHGDRRISQYCEAAEASKRGKNNGLSAMVASQQKRTTTLRSYGANSEKKIPSAKQHEASARAAGMASKQD